MSSQSARERVPSVVLFIVLFLALSTTALYAATAATTASDNQPAAAQPAPAAEPRLMQPLVLQPTLTMHRPAALVPLYVSFAALEGLDARSTLTGLGHGAQEANPVMSGLATHGAALFALKMGAAAGTILVSEKLWKRNPVAAVALMVGLNSAYALVVAHNYELASHLH